MYLNLLLTLCLSQVFLLPGTAGGNCDNLQTSPASTIVDLVTNCQIKTTIGQERYYDLAGCLLVQDGIIDGNNKLDFKAMISTLPPEILNSPDLTDDYWQIVRDCFENTGGSPAKTARIVHQCIDYGVNGENDSDFVQN